MKLHRIMPLFALVGLVLAAPARAQDEAEVAAPAEATAADTPADEAAPAEAEAAPVAEGEAAEDPAEEGAAAPVEGEEPAAAADAELPESAPAVEPEPASAPAPEPAPAPAAAEPAASAPVAEEPTAEAEADWTWMSVAGWSLLGVGTVATVVGAVVLSNPGDNLQMPLGLGAFGTGALLGVAGAVLLYLDTSE